MMEYSVFLHIFSKVLSGVVQVLDPIKRFLLYCCNLDNSKKQAFIPVLLCK